MEQARAAPAVSKKSARAPAFNLQTEERGRTICAFTECYHHQLRIERLDHRTPAGALQSWVISTLQKQLLRQFRVVSTENAMGLDQF
jgi:hypothetical protein